jgi:CHRD domain
MRKAVNRPSPTAFRRSVGALAVALAAGAGAYASLPAIAQAAPASHHTAAKTTKYAFDTLNNQADPTFNQLLGINSHNVISGYFGAGTAGHPNKGYLLSLPYGQSNYVNENFPGSAQTQVTGLNNLGDTSGFWVGAHNTNHGFVEWNGVFASYNDPKTPHMNGSVNQLLGVNDKGVAVGFYNDAKGHAHAYEVNQATSVYTSIKVPGAVSSTASAINNNGDIVGFATDSSKATSSWLMHNGHLTAFQYPGGSDTEAFGVNDKDQIVGSYTDGGGVSHGFVLSDPLGPTSHWQSIDDPNGIGSTVVNGINDAGDLVGFYTDSAGNTDGMLAIPTITSAHLTLMSMPEGTVSLGRGSGGDLTADVNMFGLTPGSAHSVVLQGPSGTVAQFGTLTANGVGQAAATLTSSYTGSIPSGSIVVVQNGTGSGTVNTEPIAKTATVSGTGTMKLTAVEVTPGGKSYGTPAGTASLSYNASAKTLTVTVNASGFSPGKHAAHIHMGSCQNQGPVVYMLMDLTANSAGKIVNETRVLTGVSTAIPVNSWYLNMHQGNSNTILKNGAPTIFFRPLLCGNV